MRSSSEVYSLMSMKSLTRLGTVGALRRMELGATNLRRFDAAPSRERANANPGSNFPIDSDGSHRCRVQVRLTCPAGTPGAAAPQSPVALEVTFGGLPTPCETASVVRVQV